ncbi:MAG: homoserine kinase [Leptospiraceae bacterium]|nr:homoserine kinase [Leptospiraceae bacterium]
MAKNKLNQDWDLFAKVPGTSANLGPGFDLLGLALDIYNEFYFKFNPDSSYVLKTDTGEVLPFYGKENLIQVAYEKYFEVFLSGKEIIPFDATLKISLPIKGGLGSSASAIVAGFLAGEYIRKNLYSEIPKPSEERILYELAMMEGHPDNTTPAYLGGFIFAYFQNNSLVYYRKKFTERVSLFLVIPEKQVETIDSRKHLPDKYNTEDVIFNMSRIATWMIFLKKENFQDLKLAIMDRLHTPYRIGEDPFYQYLGQVIDELGGCFTLSGSGPTILIFVPRKKTHEFNSRFLAKYDLEKKPEFPSIQFQRVKPCNWEAKIKEKTNLSKSKKP